MSLRHLELYLSTVWVPSCFLPPLSTILSLQLHPISENCLNRSPHFKPRHVGTGRRSCPIPNIPPNEAKKFSLLSPQICTLESVRHAHWWIVNSGSRHRLAVGHFPVACKHLSGKSMWESSVINYYLWCFTSRQWTTCNTVNITSQQPGSAHHITAPPVCLWEHAVGTFFFADAE